MGNEAGVPTEVEEAPRTLSDAVVRIAATSTRPSTLGVIAAGAISLAMGEPSEGTPAPVVDAAVTALQNARTRYSPLTGSPPLRERIARHLEARHAATFTPEQVVCTHGASAGLAAAVLATVGPSDRVVIPEPTYSLYADHVALAGGEIVWVANRPDGSVDVPRVRAALTDARMLILCSPGNPTGAVVDRGDLERLSEATAASGAFLMCDEAYADIVFDDAPFFSSLDLAERGHVICAQTFSKTYAMTGWRLGYVVAEPRIAAAVNLVHRTIVGALNTFVQDAGAVALDTPLDDLRALATSYRERRDMVVAALSGLPGVTVAPPRGAFYAFVRVDSGSTSDELVARFAEAGVLVRSGREFGPSGEGAFRISFATGVDDLREGLARIVGVLRRKAQAAGGEVGR